VVDEECARAGLRDDARRVGSPRGKVDGPRRDSGAVDFHEGAVGSWAIEVNRARDQTPPGPGLPDHADGDGERGDLFDDREQCAHSLGPGDDGV